MENKEIVLSVKDLKVNFSTDHGYVQAVRGLWMWQGWQRHHLCDGTGLSHLSPCCQETAEGEIAY